MTTTIPIEYLVPEQSFLWKREQSSTHLPVLEIITPTDETTMLDAVYNFILFSVGSITLCVLFVDALELYAEYATALVDADPKLTENLRAFLPKFRDEIKETGAQYAIIFGGGTQGLEATRALSYHKDEDEAIKEFKRVAEALERGDITVLVERISAVPYLRLEEGIELLISSTSTAGNARISPN